MTFSTAEFTKAMADGGIQCDNPLDLEVLKVYCSIGSIDVCHCVLTGGKRQTGRQWNIQAMYISHGLGNILLLCVLFH